MRSDVFVYFLSGISVNEAVTENEDGSYSIFINDGLSPDGKKAAYLHAMKHIERNDFDMGDVQSIEFYAHSCG